MSYSQYDEEKYILAACLAAHPHGGRFLDIGAWNPKTFSNTRALYEHGWCGIMVEPSPEPFLALLKEYGNEPRITLILAAIGFERSCVKFYASADAVGTTQERVRKQWEGHAAFQGTFWTPQITIPEIFNQWGGGYNFINIDAEGISADLFMSLDLNSLSPTCVCVEHDDRVSELMQKGQAAGYRAGYLNSTNLVLSR